MKGVRGGKMKRSDVMVVVVWGDALGAGGEENEVDAADDGGAKETRL